MGAVATAVDNFVNGQKLGITNCDTQFVKRWANG